MNFKTLSKKKSQKVIIILSKITQILSKIPYSNNNLKNQIYQHQNLNIFKTKMYFYLKNIKILVQKKKIHKSNNKKMKIKFNKIKINFINNNNKSYYNNNNNKIKTKSNYNNNFNKCKIKI